MKKASKSKKPVHNSQKISAFFKKITTDSNCSNGKPLLHANSATKITNTENDLQLIASDDSDVMFVDVKTKRLAVHHTPEKKRKRLSSFTDNDVVECTPNSDTVTILEQITNLPQCSKTIGIIYTTPEKKCKAVSNHQSPDIIPCSISMKDQNKYNKSIANFPRIRCIPREKLCDKRVPIDKTPEKQPISKRKQRSSEKKTPGKLFSKSPKTLHEFNVEILENFVKITPSKSNVGQESVSPTCSVEAQKHNETTPTKASQSHSVGSSSKVKMKLEFNENVTTDSKANCSMLNDDWERYFTCVDVSDHTLDLAESQHCTIIGIERGDKVNTLVVRSSKCDKTAVCDVEEFWMGMKLEVKDTVHVSAIYNESRSKWVVNNTHGLIVFNPDVLISTTSVVGSQFCSRRSILKEKYYGFEPSNQVMIVGILVHKLLQEVLKNGVSVYSEIELVAKKLMLEKDTVWMCYESDLTIANILKELLVFVPRIESFVCQYIRNRRVGNANHKKDDWNGTIDSIQDIEENIWCHELGVKGKVDVSVQADAVTIPLELKTGRATVSLEHRAQVMFYIMMMQKLGYNVSSGLLLYLREGVLREIPISAKERRDLILLRNELAYYLTRKPKFSVCNSGEMEFQLQWELPEPINHHSACSKCPYNTICCAILKYENTELGNNPLKNIQQDSLSHLEPIHIDYFMKWSALLTLEGSCIDKSKQLHEIYTVPPETREKIGQCIKDLIVKSVSECGGLYEHSFEKLNRSDNFTMQSSGIAAGNYVVVSTSKRPAVSAGFATLIDLHSITLSLDRNLNKKYAKETFHLDTYASSISQGFNMSNVALLLEPTEQAEKLRKIIIEKQPPTFNKQIPKLVAIKGTPILRRLNKMQQKAILKSLSSNDYLLIKGMPGTGKTDTIVYLIQLLVEINKTVLITSHTHSAVDNVCVRLLARGVNLLRLGSSSKINKKLHSHSEAVLTKRCQTPEQLEEVYNNAQVLAVTCLGSSHPVLNKRRMDVCIVDESTQVLQCSVFRALYSACKFILVGDPDQLPPIVRSREAVNGGLSESLFERLNTPNATVILRLNYRMNKPITDMANALTYHGQLLTGNEKVANATLVLPNAEDFLKLYKNQDWVLQALDQSLPASIRILDTGSVWNRGVSTVMPTKEESRCTNPFEIAILLVLVDALLKGGISSESIGIIAPYRAQVSQLLVAFEDRNVEISTVDQFQGRDKDIVFYSCTRSSHRRTNAESESEILDDKRRLTVAITRAKHKFILVGDLVSMRQYAPFEKLLNSLDESCFIRLIDGSLGFDWNSLMSKSFVNV